MTRIISSPQRDILPRGHHWADTGGRHQAPVHLIILDDGEQTAMQDDDLLA